MLVLVVFVLLAYPSTTHETQRAHVHMKHSVPMYTRGHAQTPAFQIWGRRGEREDALGTVLLLDQFTFGKDES